MSQTSFVSLQNLAKEIEKVSEVHVENLQKATILGVAASIPQLVAASPVDTGLYAQSWDFTSNERGIIIGNFAPHAPIIEYGARPFTPPISPLLRWAKRVLKDPSQPPNYSDRVWALARGTQKKISEQGMKPQKILENMIPSIIENIKREYYKIGK